MNTIPIYIYYFCVKYSYITYTTFPFPRQLRPILLRKCNFVISPDVREMNSISRESRWSMLKNILLSQYLFSYISVYSIFLHANDRKLCDIAKKIVDIFIFYLLIALSLHNIVEKALTPSKNSVYKIMSPIIFLSSLSNITILLQT